LFALIFAVSSLVGQETRGSLVGRVMDPTGAVMPGAGVEMVHAQTGVSAKTTTNAEGLYQALYLLPGIYKVTV
jgi:protocatechuate 3,4-dioxygenase beta subunit